MTFEALMITRMDYFTFGRVLETGQAYLSFPVVLGRCDDSEYYAITEDELLNFQSDYAAALEVVNSCRRREQDHRLLIKPPNPRGTPW